MCCLRKFATNMSSAVDGISLSKWPKVILYGDSLTQFGYSHDGCWVSLLADSLQRKCDVINRGFSGYNTAWNRIVLPKIITDEDSAMVAAVVILLGANDSNTEPSVQHVPPQEFANNLKKMIDYLTKIGIGQEKLILVSPPPCDEQAWKVESDRKGWPLTQDNKYKQQYAVSCRMVAADCNIAFIDLFMEMMQHQDWKTFFIDGLHFSKDGSQLFHSLLMPHIEKLTFHLPMMLPDWKDVGDSTKQESVLLGTAK